MYKRVLVAPLWFLCGWFVGDVTAYLIGLPDALAPMLGIATALFVVGDPLGAIWVTRHGSIAVGEPASDSWPDNLADAA